MTAANCNCIYKVFYTIYTVDRIEQVITRVRIYIQFF